jgi:hypothetical protein
VKPIILAAFRGRADQHQDGLLCVLRAGFEMDVVGPDVDVALGRQIALLPRGVFADPAVLKAADGVPTIRQHRPAMRSRLLPIINAVSTKLAADTRLRLWL